MINYNFSSAILLGYFYAVLPFEIFVKYRRDNIINDFAKINKEGNKYEK